MELGGIKNVFIMCLMQAYAILNGYLKVPKLNAVSKIKNVNTEPYL